MKNKKQLLIPLSLMVLYASTPLWLERIESETHQRSVTLALIALGLAWLLTDIIKRKRNGESWNRALAQGNKLITGNVWKDALLSFIQLAIIILLPFLIILYVWKP
jgi:hypothetical protein